MVNSFIPGTTILSAAVNQNFTDIATGLSDCLTRDGQAGMTAALKLISGSAGAPSLTFNSDATSGLYLPATGALGLVTEALGVKLNANTNAAISAAVSAGGSGYAIGDTIYIAGGTSSVVAAFTVATLSGSAVATVTMTVPGIYTVTPTNPAAQGSTSGAGTGCTLTITYNNLSSPVYNLGITDLSNALLWPRLGASSFVSGLMGKANGLDFATAIGATNIITVISNSFTFTPQGYLTPTSATPIISGDVTAATSLYYTPYTGNMIPIYNGTNLVQTTFTEQQCTLTAGAQASGGIYDVYGFLNSGTFTLGFSPTWAAGTSGSVAAGASARGSGSGGAALTRVNGILTNAAAMTLNNGATTYSIGISRGTYLGSIYVNSTAGQLNLYRGYGQSRAWDIWNAYNRSPVYLKAGDGTSSWNYTTATIRPSNNSTANSLTIFSGLSEDYYDLSFFQNILFADQLGPTTIGIGYNSTTTFSGTNSINGGASGAITIALMSNARYLAPPALGINVITSLESGATSSAFNGTQASMLLSAGWRA